MFHGKLDAKTKKGLKVLMERIAKSNIPSSNLDETLNIATWNIREFGRRKRRPASLHYIAEILGQFDIIALVELGEDLSELNTVLEYLGPYWRVLFSSFRPDDGGNHERIAYVYDQRAAVSTGLVSYVEPPHFRTASGEYLPTQAWWRHPYMASFRAGNFDFILITIHVRYASKASDRMGELKLIADWVADRKKRPHIEDKDIILLGDFNIPKRGALLDSLTSRGLRIPPALLSVKGSTIDRDAIYDQILHDPVFTDSFTNRGGVLDFYAGEHRPLFPGSRMSKDRFTYELSDHLPLWIQLFTDTDMEKLDGPGARRHV